MSSSSAADSRRLVVVGCGTMGRAIVGGLLRDGVVARQRLSVTARTADAATKLAESLGVTATHDNAAACRDADVVLLCLKPQRVEKVLRDPAVTEAVTGKLVVSIAAGVTLGRLSSLLPSSSVVRAMPNTPCLIGQGMTVVSRGERVADDDVVWIKRMFASVGECIELEPKHMDAVTSLNGSGPAFAYVMLEAMADGGVMMGLPREVALQIAAQVFRGAASMVLDTNLHPAALRDQVTTPAGCTIAGLLSMEDGRIRSVLARTVEKATRVAAELGRQQEDD